MHENTSNAALLSSIIIVGGSPAFRQNIDRKAPFYKDFIKQIREVYKHTEIYAVDMGLELLDLLQIIPNKIIGDFDSVNPQILKKYPIEIQEKFEEEKDQSDTELAVDIALNTAVQRIFLLNMEGERIDHFLFNSILLQKAPIKLQMITENELILCLNPGSWITLDIGKNKTFSLIPLTPIKSLTILGGKYSIEKKDLIVGGSSEDMFRNPTSRLQTLNNLTLTLSNLSGEKVKIYFESGVLLFYLLKPLYPRCFI